MLVDLGRNDLSRVCVPGTVNVERFLEAERFSHITHLVSEVAGEMRRGVTGFDLLRLSEERVVHPVKPAQLLERPFVVVDAEVDGVSERLA